MSDDALSRAKEGRGQAQADLLEFLAIPSVSSLPSHDADTRRACEWTAERLRGMGMTVEVADVPGGRHPVISAEWLRGARQADARHLRPLRRPAA